MNIRESIKEAIGLHEDVLKNDVFLAEWERARELIVKALLGGSQVLVAGNGGSAADAQHFATEFQATFKRERRDGYRVMPLTTNSSFLTAWTNDFGYDDIFSRQVQVWGHKGDVLVGISTSGNSKNILLAVDESKKRGLQTIGLLGGEGGVIKGKCDIALVVPSKATARIQEIHELVLHAWCEAIIPSL